MGGGGDIEKGREGERNGRREEGKKNEKVLQERLFFHPGHVSEFRISMSYLSFHGYIWYSDYNTEEKTGLQI